MVEKMKSVEKEKSAFIESQMTEHHNEVETLKQRHRSRLISVLISCVLALLCCRRNCPHYKQDWKKNRVLTFF